MKKLLALILAMLMLMATLAGCGEEKKDKDEDSKPSVSQEDPKEAATKVTDKIMEAMFEDGTGEDFVKTFPQQVIKAAEDEGLSRQDLVDTMDEAMAYVGDMFQQVEDLGATIKWKASDVTELDEDEIDELMEAYADEVGADMDIEAAMEVQYDVTVSYEGEKEVLEIPLVAIKVDGKWYFDLYSFSELDL